jgi:hypothetical protein
VRFNRRLSHLAVRDPRPKGKAARRLVSSPPKPRARPRAGNDAHRALKASFIVEAAIESGVRIAIIGNASDPCVFVFAPAGRGLDHQFACEDSFRDAVEDNLDAVVAISEREI